MRDGPVAAVDCGTNSTRLLVVDPDGRPLDRRMEVTRLGEGVDATGRLAPAAVERTLATLAGYRAVMDRLGATRGRLAATSAARDAANAADFLDRAGAATGLRPEILSGDEEGRLSFLGATARPPAGIGPGRLVLVVDIGGGSTELVAGEAGRPETARAVSVDVGCVRVTERHLRHDPPTAEELAVAGRAVAAAVDEAAGRLPAGARGAPLIGLAGTVATLALLDQGADAYSRAAVHHHRLARSAVDDWLARLAAEPAGARRARPGMEPGRADVIVGGILVLAAVMDRFSSPSCTASEDDILDGLATSVLGPARPGPAGPAR